MSTIAEMLEQGRSALEAEQARVLKADLALEAAAREQFDHEWGRVVAFVRSAWPALTEYIQPPEYKPGERLGDQLPLASFDLDVAVWGLDSFSVRLHRANTDGHLSFYEPAIHLYRPYREQSQYGSNEYLARDKRDPVKLQSVELPMALALAEQYGQQAARLGHEIDAANQARAEQRRDLAAKAAAAPSDSERALSLLRELADLVQPHQEEA